jgi:hypothetical protein
MKRSHAESTPLSIRGAGVRPTRRLASWLLAAALGAACTTVAAACYWDRDTLKAEAAGLPGVVEAVVGRFDRHPASYYEARLGRAMADRAADARDWRSWDDAVVALDRLGRFDEAVALAEQQRSAMDAAAAGTGGGDHAPTDDDRYRQLANHGTVLAHRWVAAGAADSTADLEAAREAIAAAIELNPDAHFGREAWQLLAIEWLLDGATIRATGDEDAAEQWAWSYPVPSMLDLREPPDDAIEGLVGIITLGGGWGSIDVLVALHRVLGQRRDSMAAVAVSCRIEELISEGRRPLHPATEMNMAHRWQRDDPTLAELTASPESHPLEFRGREAAADGQSVRDWYVRARAATRDWHAERTAWVDRRLLTHHPDRDPDFWEGAPPAPAMAYPRWGLRNMDPLALGLTILVGLSVVLVVGSRLLVRMASRWWARRRAASAASPSS